MGIKVYISWKRRVLALIAVLCQLLYINCSRQAYPNPSFQNIENQAENKKLKKFMEAGAEKEINTRNTNSDEIIKSARKYLGVPHCMGGTTKKCMDCSGLLVRAFADNGIHLPHNSEEQARYGKIIPSIDDLKKGDLVFFIRSYDTHNFITHSGIYLGNSQFIHTSSTKGVSITSINEPWWKEKFIFGTRVFR